MSLVENHRFQTPEEESTHGIAKNQGSQASSGDTTFCFPPYLDGSSDALFSFFETFFPLLLVSESNPLIRLVKKLVDANFTGQLSKLSPRPCEYHLHHVRLGEGLAAKGTSPMVMANFCFLP